MKLAIIFMNLLFVNLCFTQSEYPYSKYVDLVLLAEDAYALDDFCKANEIYKKIIAEVETPFHEEMIKALDSAKKCDDENQLLSISIKLAKGGIAKTYFKQFDDTFWFKTFIENFAEYEIYFKENYNSQLKEKCISLIIEDSIYNAEFHKFRRGEKFISLNELTTGAEQISNKFKNIVEVHGFPSEKRMGYHLQDDQLKDYDLWELLIHIFARGELFYNTQSYTEMIGKGDMHFLDQIFLENIFGHSGIPDYGIVNEAAHRFNTWHRP